MSTIFDWGSFDSGSGPRRFAAPTLAMLLAAMVLAGCGEQARKPGQALASVNGAEITVLQLNEELQRAAPQAAPTEAASKQLLEALIDRQLLQNAAAKEKLDRDPEVVQAVERAKALIVAQAYLKKRIGALARPSRREIEDYFTRHPEFFARRKQIDMRQLLVASGDVDDALKAALDAARSLDDMALWLDAHKVKYARAQLAPTSAELAPELSARLLAMPRGQLFIVQEGEHSMLVSIAEVRDTPVTLELAAPAIEQFLLGEKSRAAARVELARLRSAARIEYLNQLPAAAGTAAADAADAARARGVAALR